MKQGRWQHFLIAIVACTLMFTGCDKLTNTAGKAALPKAGSYTVLKEEKAQNWIGVSILVSPRITEPEIIALLKGLVAFYQAEHPRVTIWMYTSKEQFASDMGLWLARILPGDKGAAWNMEIDHEQLQYLRAAPVEKFGLTEDKRRAIYKEMWANDYRAWIEATQTFPDLDSNRYGWTQEKAQLQHRKQSRHKDELAQKYRSELAPKYGLTDAQLAELNLEGGKKKWPTPVPPTLKELSASIGTTHPAQAQEWTKLRGGHFLATSQGAFQSANGLTEAALNKLVQSGLVRATVDGTDVFVVAKHGLDEGDEVRVNGDPAVYRVFSGALYPVADVAADTSGAVSRGSAQACKIEGISIDGQGAVAFVSSGAGFNPLKKGERACGGEVVQMYRPTEPDGSTPQDPIDINFFRIRMRFADGERVLKNGDVF